MSWLFGVKKPDPIYAPLDETQGPSGVGGAPGGGGGNPGGGGGNDGKDDGKNRMAYSFDSEALERAAKAAKDLEKSSNAKDALALSKMQEETRQLEFKAQMKQMDASMENSKVEQRKVAEEERRKTMAEETKQMKLKAEYQDQLARKRLQDEMAMKKQLEADNLAKQEESVKKQEAMRRSTIEHELKLKHQYDMERVEAEALARAKAERENRDVIKDKIRVEGEERRKTVIEAIKTGGTVLGAGVEWVVKDWKTTIPVFATGVAGMALGWFAMKRGTGVIATYTEARLGKPSLIRETSRISPIEAAKNPIQMMKKLWKPQSDPLKGVVLSPALESRLRDIALTTSNTKRNNGFFRNVMFYGPPGTGKTMFAKGLANHSGLDYAIMTGGDVAPMGRDGVSAIHKVFNWANSSRKGVLLFVDEADAFLRKRSLENISEDMRATLNAFLYRTGEQSNKVMLCIASNQPEQFDWAVNDRIDELVNFGIPGLDERKRMILEYFDKFIATPATSGSKKNRLKLDSFDWVEKCNDVASKTQGLSGREISKLVVSFQAAAYASESGVLTEAMIDERTEETMKQHGQKMVWLEAEEKIKRKREMDLEKSLAESEASGKAETVLKGSSTQKGSK